MVQIYLGSGAPLLPPHQYARSLLCMWARNLGAGGAGVLWALGALGVLRALGMLRALRALGMLRALRVLGALGGAGYWRLALSPPEAWHACMA